MAERTTDELRVYLKARAYAKARKYEPDKDFDLFLKDVESLDGMRLAAEERFKKNRHLAKAESGALPLEWSEIARFLQADDDKPEVSLASRTAAKCVGVLREILDDIRKILIRKREMTPLPSVRQIDPHCMRWLTRRPGRDTLEKAGASQKILSVVRVENRDTLENRVLKDFAARALPLCDAYLWRNGEKFKNRSPVKNVRRLRNLCEKTLADPILENVASLNELPHPNYVLRYDRRYSRIWRGYCAMVRFATIAERLWKRHDELFGTLITLLDESRRHTAQGARFHSPIWFNPVDGKSEFLENPFYETGVGIPDASFSQTSAPTTSQGTSDRVIDLTAPPNSLDLLIYSERHQKNAKPYLQDRNSPSLEDLNGQNHHWLHEILAAGHREKLRDYFEQLHAKLGGERWVLLIPDDMKIMAREEIIKSVPLHRDKVTLLWRSVAAAIGWLRAGGKQMKDGDKLLVESDESEAGTMFSMLTLSHEETHQRLVPARRSFEFTEDTDRKGIYSRRKPASAKLTGSIDRETFKERFLWGRKTASASPKSAPFEFETCRHRILATPELCAEGACIFLRELDAGIISYFDELEPLNLIVQTPDERVTHKELVEANPKVPGGKAVEKTVENAFVINASENKVRFYLRIGKVTPDASLTEPVHELPVLTPTSIRCSLHARITPGQGMAILTVKSDSPHWKELEIDYLKDMKDCDLTIAIIEEELERSFPPNAPRVRADSELWGMVEREVSDYISGRGYPRGNWFTKGRNLYNQSNPLPVGASPLDRFMRRNVFGNDPGHRLPIARNLLWFGNDFDFNALFKKLAADLRRHGDDSKERRKIIGLIAWTYQFDNPVFAKAREQTLRKYAELARGHPGIRMGGPEYTLLANLCATPEEWRDCLFCICLRMENDTAKSNDLRLLYNLLQFHPTLIEDVKFHEDQGRWELIENLRRYYNNNKHKPRLCDFALRCILYMLRCRRFDGKRFLTEEHEPMLFNRMKRSLSERLCLPEGHYFGRYNSSRQSALERNNHSRETVLAYLCNKGTIDGLPVDDDTDNEDDDDDT